MKRTWQQVFELDALRWRFGIAVVHEYDQFRIELIQKLAATAARDWLPGEGDTNGFRFGMSGSHGAAHGDSFCTNRQAIGCVFDVASRVNLSILHSQCGSHVILRIGCVGSITNFTGGCDKLLPVVGQWKWVAQEGSPVMRSTISGIGAA
jgi:hypothetical protein